MTFCTAKFYWIYEKSVFFSFLATAKLILYFFQFNFTLVCSFIAYRSNLKRWCNFSLTLSLCHEHLAPYYQNVERRQKIQSTLMGISYPNPYLNILQLLTSPNHLKQYSKIKQHPISQWCSCQKTIVEMVTEHSKWKKVDGYTVYVVFVSCLINSDKNILLMSCAPIAMRLTIPGTSFNLHCSRINFLITINYRKLVV
jgi:Tfp pilus assembly major pilin PilA